MTHEYPPVRGLQLEDSEQFLQLQVADLVAGAACAVLNAKARNARSDYTDQLLDVGILDSIGGGVWPTSAISPEQLETEGPTLKDAAEFIGEIVALREKRQASSERREPKSQ